MAEKVIPGKSGSQLEVTQGLPNESQAQAAAALDDLKANDTQETGGKINSLMRVKVPVCNDYFTYTFLPELFLEQFDVDLKNGVPDGWKQIKIGKSAKDGSTAPKGNDRNPLPPGISKFKRRVIGKKVIIPLPKDHFIKQTLVGKPNKDKIIKRLFLRFPSVCSHIAIAVWLSKVIPAAKMPATLKIEQLSFPMPVEREYTTLIVPKWIKSA
ncbi:hypothetical protein PL8927_510020 [Planktothrix serta PCC 8927]|uniref:Uncharacterized protein n=1 Tax=Planktothrix serta PCC 8927 TaxID=671068 RepID=A0A7Z9BMY7_9CYAN|nr:hypothetical protein [Planktothrix serta]VXD15992.1 hypothetical protein PL8927_510020 [Planktothrix serta PCC 8927]